MGLASGTFAISCRRHPVGPGKDADKVGQVVEDYGKEDFRNLLSELRRSSQAVSRR